VGACLCLLVGLCRHGQTPALHPLLSRSQSRRSLTQNLTLGLTQNPIRNPTQSRSRTMMTTTTEMTTMTKITIIKDAMAKLAAMTTTTGNMTMTEEELAKHDSKTLLQLLLSADARCDALTAERDRLREAVNQSRLAFAGYVSVQSAIDLIDRAALKGEKP